MNFKITVYIILINFVDRVISRGISRKQNAALYINLAVSLTQYTTHPRRKSMASRAPYDDCMSTVAENLRGCISPKIILEQFIPLVKDIMRM